MPFCDPREDTPVTLLETPQTRRPASATHPLVAYCGVLTFVAGVVACRYLNISESYERCMYVGAAVALGITAPDIFWQKIYCRSLYAEPVRAGSWGRVLTKCLGLYGSAGFIALLYWLFPEYSFGKDSFYLRYWQFLEVVMPYWAAATPLYIWWTDRRQPVAEDNLWHFGRLLTFRWGNIPPQAILQNMLGWLVKGYFFPLMFIFNANNVDQAMGWNMDGAWDFDAWYNFLFFALYFADCAFASVAYIMSLRALDTQIVTAEPTVFGWVVAIACYPPFTNFLGAQYFAWDHNTIGWNAIFRAHQLLYVAWGCAILFLVFIFAWSTVVFGNRFSNLTNRGIITSGPYRFTKHPAYISKNISWWMASLPFLVNGPPSMAIKNCMLLVLFNGMYYLRAKTEERHLSLDPVYRDYAAWIEENGIFRWMRHVPFLRRLAMLRLRFGTVPAIGNFTKIDEQA